MSALDAMYAALRTTADGWATEATRRRALTATDPAADTLDHCAAGLRAQVDALARDTYWVSVEDYARLHHCTPATVRARLRRGDYVAGTAAVQTAKGWRLRPDAVPGKPLRKVG